jgi:hypothetical protein
MKQETMILEMPTPTDALLWWLMGLLIHTPMLCLLGFAVLVFHTEQNPKTVARASLSPTRLLSKSAKAATCISFATLLMASYHLPLFPRWVV